MRMQNQVAIVTGAASGLGKAIAARFATEGAKVAVADMDIAGARRAVGDIEGNGGTAIAVEMDVTDEQSVDEGVGKVVDAFGGVNVLVSNAGNQHIDRVENLQLKDWKKLLAIHLDGAFLTTRACLRHMYDAGNGGSIIYMGSVHSHEASRLKAPYVTAKHGLIGLCRTVAKEGAEHGVRANVICPGFVRTPLVEKQIPEQARNLNISEEAVVTDVMLRDTVDKEFTTLEDVAEMAVIFAAFPSNAMTGQSVLISHGWCMR